ncbi:hypothetical protein ONZ43_g4919 [Nemania bipapillata]|uniref:Uncharacterized protein n=1 Tax=Nemania bipapillata TaxID=110536 RepID=A0ACC2IGZ0_9PEZI|nr:hypothetical protein ONZ43_g4919 [Nemania bipapillata]
MFATLRTEVDFRDGKEVKIQDHTAEAKNDAFKHPVPEDLYMPYGAFIEKYNLSAAFNTVYQISQGMGDLLHVPTIYAAKYFNTGDIRAMTDGYLTHAHGNNSEIYSKAGEYISHENILLNSVVISSNRRKNTTAEGRGAELLVSTRGAGVKLLSCDQIVLAMPPDLSNLAGWDLTEQERESEASA